MRRKSTKGWLDFGLLMGLIFFFSLGLTRACLACLCCVPRFKNILDVTWRQLFSHNKIPGNHVYTLAEPHSMVSRQREGDNLTLVSFDWFIKMSVWLDSNFSFMQLARRIYKEQAHAGTQVPPLKELQILKTATMVLVSRAQPGTCSPCSEGCGWAQERAVAEESSVDSRGM